MADSDGLEFNKEVLGREYPAGRYLVTREIVLDYLSGVGDANPTYTQKGLLAPPTLVAIFAKWLEPRDLGLKFEGHDYMAGQYVEPLAPIKPGDQLTCRARVTDVYKKTGRSGPMVFVVIEYTFVNQRGEKVALVGMSSVRRK